MSYRVLDDGSLTGVFASVEGAVVEAFRVGGVEARVVGEEVEALVQGGWKIITTVEAAVEGFSAGLAGVVIAAD